MNASPEVLARLQSRQERVRNMCIMAHVDHGKTTLSDHLIVSNGLIHPRLAGELRYLDSREDEQERGITMKSSSIALLYVPGASVRPEGPKGVPDDEKLGSGYLVNLIDSPGHVDFCSEVSTAARLSDGALVVVDAVEGVCIQTHAVLRQAYEEKVTPCLFINKIDRLILELKFTPAEAYARLQSIVTHANMIVSSFHSERFMSEADAVLAHEGAKEAAAAAAAAAEEGDGEGEHANQNGTGTHEEEDEEDAFQPVRCNVAFGSAYDGWAFTLDQFAGMYAEKLGAKREALVNALWGDYSFSPKDKRVVKIKRSESSRAKPMFVQFVLEPIWKAYSVCEPGEDVAGVLGQIVKSRNLPVPPKALEHPEAKQALRAVMRSWLPLSEAVLSMAVTHLPSPVAAAPTRVPRLLGSRPGVIPASLAAELPGPALAEMRRAEASLAASSSDPAAPLLVFVSKMVAVPASSIPRLPGEPGPSTPEVFLAFGRVYSGVVQDGQLVHVLSAAYSPGHPASGQRQVAVIRGVYMMMGRALERLKAVPAGNVVALGGLDTSILKSATLSSTPAARPLAPMTFQAAAIVKVAVEPVLPSEMPQLVEGLRLLNRADPFVEVSVQPTGEHVLGAAGEVHLETCVKDLKERFARIQIHVSPPLVAFRETVSHPAEAAEAGATGAPGASTQQGGATATGSTPGGGGRVVEAVTPNGVLAVRVRAWPLPAAFASTLDDNQEVVKRLLESQGNTHSSSASGGDGGESAPSTALPAAAAAVAELASTTAPSAGLGAARTSAQQGQDAASRADSALLAKLAAVAQEAGPLTQSLLSRAWLLGPRGCGPNLLLAPHSRSLNSSSSAAAATSAAASSSNLSGLFDVPQPQVVRVSKQQGPPGGGTCTTTSNTGAVDAGYSTSTAAGQQEQNVVPGQSAVSTFTVHVPLGTTNAAAALGLAGLRAAGASSSNLNGMSAVQGEGVSVTDHTHAVPEHVAASVESGVVAGFQLATAAGPLCEEPMWGVMLEVDARLNSSSTAATAGGTGEGGSSAEVVLELQEDVYGPFSGQVMTATAAACRRALMEAEPRLAEAMYLCAVQASAEALSGMYAVLNRRRARILREEMREGSDTFLVHAHLPVEASFGLADEMRRKSSGAASASLLLSHWERLHVDPFFVPTTEEEREEWGEEGVGGAGTNLARKLIDAVRRRKGLPVEEKVVKAATKQRTLKRNV